MRSIRRRPITAAVAASALVGATLALTPTAGASVRGADQDDAPRARTALPSSGANARSMLDERLAGSDPTADGARSTRLPASGPVQVMLELDAGPTSSAYSGALTQGRPAAAAAARQQRGRVLAGQRRVEGSFGARSTRATVLWRTSSVYSGVAVSTDASRLPALEALPGVKAVHALVPKRLANSSTVPLIRAREAWAAAGTGKGIRIGVVDTGIDYTHAHFGGPGTKAAFDAAAASNRPAYPRGGSVVGGIDLAGDDYDPGATLGDGSPDESRNKPNGDANPLDCDGHGSHVAGTAAGRGVTKAGRPYAGPWTKGLDTSGFRIGPGVAPAASLYAIKVFGCEGTTDLIIPALDWAADPNRDGDVSDRLDVVNLSVGGDFASPQDPDAVAAENLAKLGTVVVASAGNAGDVQDALGSPASATRAIAVAASDDAVAVLDGLRVDAPRGVEPSPSLDGAADNVFAAVASTGDATNQIDPYDWARRGVRNAPLVTIGRWSAAPGSANNSDGCDPYSAADAARAAGKVVLLRWTESPDERCGSNQRGKNAVAAGAVGVVLGGNVNSTSSGIAGDPRLPVMLLLRQGTDAIKRAVDASGNNGSVRVSLTNAYHNAVRVDQRGTSGDPTDRIATLSSRGFGTARAVKPDVTAPGVSVFSTDAGTGAGGESISGTSMSSPHVAGVAALVRAAHRTWTVEQVKAAIMNTAGARVRSSTGSRALQSPARAGAGRVQADRAVGATTLAYLAGGSGAVGVSFGHLAVVRDTTLTRTLRVQNTASRARTYTLSYRPHVATPGVGFTVSPSRVTVPARGSVNARVTLRLTPSAMRRTLDPSMDSQDGLRSYYADAGGLVFVTTSGTSVTVPVYAAPRPASAMTQRPTVTVGASATDGRGVIDLVGRPLRQGSLDGGTAYASTVTALMLQGTSARGRDCTRRVVTACTPFADDRAGDLRYVGVASDIPYTRDSFNAAEGADSGFAYFGISTWGPWRTPAGYAEFDVYLDTDAGSPGAKPGPELMLFNSRLEPDSDVMVAALGDLRTGEVVDVEPLNAAVGALDTGLFNSDSMVLPAWLPAMLPYLPKKADGSLAATRVNYWVKAGTAESGPVDAVGSASRPLSVDLRWPSLRAEGNADAPALNDDRPGREFRLTVHRDTRTLKADAPKGLLLVHHQNRNGSRAQVVRVLVATTTRLTSSATSYRAGARPTLKATVAPAAATGTVTFVEGRRVLGRAAVVKGTASITAPALARGRHVVRAVYSGSGAYASSRSAATTLTVR